MRRQWSGIIACIVFFICIFWFSRTPFDYDIWFHIKSGEILAKQGIIFHDVFSRVAPNRAWYPYEWLFQVGVYTVVRVFGFGAIAWVAAGVSTLLVALIVLILHFIIDLPIILTLATSLSFYALVYDFLTARPHLPSAIFFLSELFLILLYLVKKKNLLWLIIPLSFVWANMHATVVLAIVLAALYMIASALYWLKTKSKEWAERTVTLAVLTLMVTAATVLPPLGFVQYRVLLLFWYHKELIMQFLDEWMPLNAIQVDFFPFIVASIVTMVPFGIFLLRSRHRARVYWMLPLLPFIFFGIVAIRNLLWSYIALTLVYGSCLAYIVRDQKYKRFAYGFCLAATILSVWLVGQKMQPERTYVPDNAVKFLKLHHINGNLFNGIGVGGYLLYHLYPEYRVFIDGRADVYLCCEIPDLVRFLQQKNLPDEAWKKDLDALLTKYDISFVLHTTKRNTVSRRIGEMLGSDPQWALIYWGDDFQILVKRNGKNDALIAEFGVSAATPLELSPYKNGMEGIAESEYRRMLSIADSARSRNALAVLLMKRGQFAQARKELDRAIAIEPLYDSPYMNEGELDVREGKWEEAIVMYRNALKVVSDRGFTYIRLGTLYVDGFHDIKSAKIVWQEGLAHPVGREARNKLQSLLQDTQ